ncbi:DUF4160 domain-containing protein [Bacillus sp. MCCB 382]|uniref:DUF4160 domain-containing protein n=1 Tax=Bacillus sp. MCCB 382 TaxID=2860197 RepID=UPI001C560534|nr:DUF4160 domain-containing protein [Bacillus sp. MCCB 382]
MYYNDHDPPHFHVIYAGFMTRIEIMTGEYVRGDDALPSSKEKIVMKWLQLNKGPPKFADHWHTIVPPSFFMSLS